MNDSAYLSALAAAQTQTIAGHVLPDGRRVWLRKAGRRNPAWRYVLLGAAVRLLRLAVLTPVPNLGGNAGIATEAARLKQLDAAGLRVPQLLAVQENALLMSDLGGETLLHQIEQEAAQGRLHAWRQGLSAIEAAHGRGQYLSQAFARNLVVDADGRIGFIDFEDDPGAVLDTAQCQSRDWLCYLHSTAAVLQKHGLLPEALALWRACLARQPAAVRTPLLKSVRPILWMRRLCHPRWGSDTLRLAALAALFYAVLHSE